MLTVYVYLGDGRVEICNNLVESAIRPTKLGTKNWLFHGNEGFGQKCAILYTIVKTADGTVARVLVSKISERQPGTETITRLRWLGCT